jgi:hypothetical protein
MDHTGCRLLTFLTILPSRVVTPICQVGYMKHTGFLQLMLVDHIP